MNTGILQPDTSAVGLFAFGLIMLFVPMMLMPGLIAMLAALSYWVIMVLVKAVNRRRK